MISVVMPVYNSEKYLGRAIESVLGQTYRDLELIIIDDGSTDSSRNLINSYADIDSRIRVICQKNMGVSTARNAGIDAANGEWLYFIDSDDYVDSQFFQEIMLYNESYDVIISGVIRHYENSKNIDSIMIPPILEQSDENKYCEFLGKIIKDRNQDLIYNYMWNKVIRKTIVIDRNIRFNEELSLGEDFLFNCDLLDCLVRIKTIPKAYYHYIIHSGTSLANRFYNNELERRRLLFKRLKDLYIRHSAYKEYKKYLEIREGRFSYYSLSKINYKTCTLSTHDKIQYIDGFLKNRGKFMAMYLAQEGGIKNYIKRIVILTGNAKIICYLYLLFTWFAFH